MGINRTVARAEISFCVLKYEFQSMGTSVAGIPRVYGNRMVVVTGEKRAGRNS